MSDIDLSPIAQSTAAIRRKTKKDPQDESEERAMRQQAQSASLGKIRAETVAIRYIGKLRQQYANKVFCYLIWYSVFSTVFLVASGYKNFTGFNLPDSVLLTIVGSTAVSAIGLVGFVVSGLFKNIK